MSPLAPFPCSKTDAVLALHLDGDLAELPAGTDDCGYAFLDQASLHAHLRECSDCQATLRRARRLDAVLATTAGAAQSTHEGRAGSSWAELQQRWFGKLAEPVPTAAGATVAPSLAAIAVPIATPPIVTAAPDHERSWRPEAVLVGSALAAILLMGLWCCRPHAAPVFDAPSASRRPTAAPLHATPTPVPPAVTPAVIPNASTEQAVAVAEPRIAESHVAEPLAAAPELVVADDAVRHLRQRQANLNKTASARTEPQPVSMPTAQLAARIGDNSQAASERVAAARHLLGACSAFAPDPQGAFRTLLIALAGCGDFGATPSVHQSLLDVVRESARARSLLAAQLLQPLPAPTSETTNERLVADAALVVAARLGGETNDALVRRAARHRAEPVQVVAAALRCGVRPEGGARLLLDLWRDLDSRGAVAADADVARAWFSAQAPSVFCELLRELATSRASDRRRHCLLALGAADDGSTLPALLAAAQSRHADEAHTAAFALSCLPRPVLAPLVPLAAAEEAFLLRAALARADHPAAKAWIDALSLRPADRQSLHTGALAQFPEVASWFRERGAASD